MASDLRERYSGSLLGVYWSVINPVILILVYTFVFSFILKVKFHQNAGPLDFPLYLICGLLPWVTVQESLTRAAGCI